MVGSLFLSCQFKIVLCASSESTNCGQNRLHCDENRLDCDLICATFDSIARKIDSIAIKIYLICATFDLIVRKVKKQFSVKILTQSDSASFEFILHNRVDPSQSSRSFN